MLTGTLIGALGAAAAVCAVYLLGSWTPLLRRAGVESITDPRAVALLLALATLAGLAAAPAAELRLAAHRGPGRRARAGPDRRSGHCGAHGAAAGHHQPGRRRPAPAGVPVLRQPSVRRGADGRRPGLRAGRAMTPDPAGHQRLPAPARRHPAVRAQPRRTAAARLPGRLRLALEGLGEVRRRAAVPGDPGGDRRCCCRRPAVARRAAEIAREHGCDRVWFGAAAPLGLLAGGPAASGPASPGAVALTHGHEVGWAALPGARGMLRRIGRGVDVVTYLGEYTRVRLARVLGDLTTLERLAPGVDTDAFHPDVDGDQVRAEHGLTDRPVVVCVSRLVPRKGQDTLIRALPAIRRRVPDAALLLVGGGPYRSDPGAAGRASTGVADHVVFTGSVPWAELPAHYAAGDVFAMPCRTRRGGLDVEGLGIVYLEASATGLPVVAGDSGGAPDAVRRGRDRLRGGRARRRGAGRPGGGAARRPGPGPAHGRGRPGLGGGAVALGHPGRPPCRALLVQHGARSLGRRRHRNSASRLIGPACAQC